MSVKRWREPDRLAMQHVARAALEAAAMDEVTPAVAQHLEQLAFTLMPLPAAPAAQRGEAL